MAYTDNLKGFRKRKMAKKLNFVIDELAWRYKEIEDKISEGDFIFVPDGAMHQPVNTGESELRLIVARNTPVEIVEERTIGPSLGSDSIDSGRKAMLLGLLMIIIFIIIIIKIF